MYVSCVVDINMMGASHGGAMENYFSWYNDGRVMQSNPNMNNSLSKHYTIALCVCPSVCIFICLSGVFVCVCLCEVCLNQNIELLFQLRGTHTYIKYVITKCPFCMEVP